MNGVRASIVVPTRNRLPLLQEAVESVLCQTFGSWEMEVVDDASEDGTWAWLSSLNDPRIHAIRLNEHRERSVARNCGLLAASGEFVLFLDDDDLLVPGALDALVEAFGRWPEAVAAVGSRTVFGAAGHPRRVRHPRFYRFRNVWAEVLFGSWVGIPGQTLYRTSLLKQMGGWNADAIPAEDHELWLRLALRGPVVIVPVIVLKYRAHRGQSRSADVYEIEERFRRQHILELPEPQRDRGLRIIRARHDWIAGISAYQNCNYPGAARSFVSALLTAAELLRSPVVTPGLLSLTFKALAGAVVGQTIMALLRAIRNALRNALKRNPTARQELCK
jgi:glycosyltransferase involved in cell wall biosynthesis